MPRWTFLLLAGLLLGAATLAGCGAGGMDGPTPTPLPGTLLDPPKEVSDFTLTDHTGQPFRLSNLRGKVALLFFGYTNCPNVCPTTLGDFKRVKALLGQDAARVAFVFVSVDGERDTPDQLAIYVRAFDPDFIGLMGDDATIRTIARDYGVFYQRVSYEGAAGYLVDHTASTFGVDQDGRLRLVFSYGTDPAAIVARVRALF